MSNHHSAYYTEVTPSPPKAIGDVTQFFTDSGWGMILLGGVILLASNALLGSKKSKISTGRFGGQIEKWAAGFTADRQRQQRKPNKVALKAGNVDIPHAQQSITITGAPDSGKTFSIIDPAIRSAIAQGLPIVVYDFKGAQIEAHLAWAAAQGYQVHVFAPGQPYTGVCNPLDFLSDESDSLMASQLAQVMQRNTQRQGGHQDDFFASAGTNLVEGVMLLAKMTPYPDLLMASKILNLPDLPLRLRYAEQSGWIPQWTLESFSQLLSSESAEKQVAGIIAMAQRTFKSFIGKQLVSSFCGKTTIPLDLSGKQILFLQVDIQKRDAVSPLLAAILHLIVTRNFAKPRKEPLIVSLDELPTLYLPDLPKWINEFRSYGFVALLGYQNFAQLQYIYGRELSRALFAACGTKVFFNPKDRETAGDFSSYLGEKEVRYYTRSHNQGKGGSSRSEQYQKMPLLTPDQILKLDQGECVFINPGYKGGGEASIPFRSKVRVSPQDVAIQKRSIELWNSEVRDRLIQRETKRRSMTEIDQENVLRREMALRLLPLATLESASNQQDFNADITEDEFDDAFR